MTTNVPAPSFTDRGFVAPAESEILTGVLEDYQQAFGGGLNVALTSPQGQLATSQAACVGNANNLFVALTQQMDPAFASGRMQDGIARIYFLTRLPSRPTVVAAVCSGLTGVVIPVGARARAQDGNTYTSTEQQIIPDAGFVTVSLSCDTVGPIPCAANTLTAIYQAILGWDSINNPTDGVIGTNTETRQAFEARRRASVAVNALGVLGAVLGAVLSVDDVLDAYVTSNDTAAPVTRGGITLPARSLYVAAVGGSSADIAHAIFTKKNPGCGYYGGNTTVTVEDTNPAYNSPYPSYAITFERPDDLLIVFLVKLAAGAQVPADAEAQIKAAIIAAFSGADGGTRATIGSTIYASRFFAPVAMLGSWAQIISLQIGSENNPNVTITASVAGTTLTVTAVSSNALAAGQTLFDAPGALAANTQIVSQISGSTGSTGTYLLSIAQTISSRTMLAVAGDRNSVGTNINQVPSINTDNITVLFV